MEQQTGFKEMFLRLVAIVGLIAVLILGAWGIILLAFNLVGLFTGTVHFSNLFNHSTSTPTTIITPAATTTAPVVIVPNTTGSNTNTSNTGTTVGSSAPTAVYTPAAKPATTLYGQPDLKVVIQSVTSLSSVQGRTVVQFSVINGGTNTAPQGWSFDAMLPYQGSTYTYHSQGQRALNPGDSIAFTLTYDNNYAYGTNYNGNNNGTMCTYQYQANCYYNGTYYTQYPYTVGQNSQPQTCYSYNGYQNVAVPCTDSNGNYIYNQNYNYYNQYGQNYNNGYYSIGTVTVSLDPMNYVHESNEYNNTASKSF